MVTFIIVLAILKVLGINWDDANNLSYYWFSYYTSHFILSLLCYLLSRAFARWPISSPLLCKRFPHIFRRRHLIFWKWSSNFDYCSHKYHAVPYPGYPQILLMHRIISDLLRYYGCIRFVLCPKKAYGSFIIIAFCVITIISELLGEYLFIALIRIITQEKQKFIELLK